MTQNTNVFNDQDDLTEGDPNDSDLIKKLRKQLKDERNTRKSLAEENESFRQTRTQERVQAIQEAVNGLGYPQSIVDTLVAKVQDSDEDEFASILDDLNAVAGEEGASSDDVQVTPPPVERGPSPSDLGQQLAAAAAGGSAVDGVARLAAAQSIDEVNAIAKELGLDQV